MKLTDKQALAASHIDGPCLVLAVPGAGKTTMILERINILSKEINPEKILSLTFSRTQAEDMKNRYYMDPTSPKTNFMTIHAFCYLIIRNYYKKQGKKLKILESDETYNKYNLIRKIYYDINGKIISEEDLKNFFTDIGFMRNAMVGIDYLNNSHIKNVRAIYEAYENFKKEHGYIDFDDMQLIAFKLLNEDERLLRSVKNKYQYIQLDEGQDTSLLQFKILEKIVYPANNLLVVADDDQSIYGFRAASPEYLLNFKNIYPAAKIITMDENHRSQKNIVDVSAKFISQNKNRYSKNLFTQKNPTSQIHLRTVKTSKDSYNYIIKNLEKDKTNAILFRNNISALNLISFLMDDGIDFSYETGSTDYFNSKITRDIRDIITFSEDPYDTEIFTSIYYKIKTYLSKAEVDKLIHKPVNYTVFDYLYELVDDNKAHTISEKEKQFKHIKNLTLDKKISFIYFHMGYKNYIKEFTEKNHDLILNKDLYIESLINFTKGLKTIDEYKVKVKSFEKTKANPKKSKLILSTIHKSKGLEYDNVFVIDLVKNEFPIFIDDKNWEERLEEERRIFYVAMTRAKENLHLITLSRRNQHQVEPSPFFTDIRNQSKKPIFGYKNKVKT